MHWKITERLKRKNGLQKNFSAVLHPCPDRISSIIISVICGIPTGGRKISDTADYCIIDCAPDINISTINALVASDLVLIPIKIDNFAFDGLAELKEQVENVREDFNPDINFSCFVTCFQNNEVNRQGEEWLNERRTEYPLFNTHIRRSIKVDESTFANAPIIEYTPRCGAAADYKELAKEILSVSESDT